MQQSWADKQNLDQVLDPAKEMNRACVTPTPVSMAMSIVSDSGHRGVPFQGKTPFREQIVKVIRPTFKCAQNCSHLDKGSSPTGNEAPFIGLFLHNVIQWFIRLEIVAGCRY